jgi:hypothetical protein
MYRSGRLALLASKAGRRGEWKEGERERRMDE